MDLCAQWASRWPASEQATAYGVCQGESSGNPNAHCLDCFRGVHEDSRGLGQVNVVANSQFASWDLFDPQVNAEASYQIWQSQGWSAWSAFKSGSYLRYAQSFPGAAASAPFAQPITPDPVRLSGGLLLVGGIAAAYLLLTS